MTLELGIFYLAAIFAIGGAVMMILQKNPVASVLYMVLSLVAQAILYVQLSALFVGALLVIVYAGAILVLFLFVIMLLNLRGESFEGKQARIGKVTKIVFAVLFFAEAMMIIKNIAIPIDATAYTVAIASDFGAVEPVSTLLFTDYLYPFELTSILLLVAIVGAVVLAKRDKSEQNEGEI
ncbi:MAG: NADH-quinone oxidoreductase subunit J [Candidatus Zixiibacteriota bacterium]